MLVERLNRKDVKGIKVSYACENMR
jgi:hypothetical protein